jgi:outer membrane immunogenic protein
MKKILLATSALLATVCVASAADLAARHYAKAPVAPIATVYDWTGFYIGGHVGGGWGDQGRSTAGDVGFSGWNCIRQESPKWFSWRCSGWI